MELARQVMAAAETCEPLVPLYPLDLPVADKVRIICREIYGADDVAFTKQAEKDLRKVEKLAMTQLPVCIAKASSSLSDDPSLVGRPRGFDVTVRGIEVNSGAGFLVVFTGDILRMPGLPKEPAAQRISVTEKGVIAGLE